MKNIQKMLQDLYEEVNDRKCHCEHVDNFEKDIENLRIKMGNVVKMAREISKLQWPT